MIGTMLSKYPFRGLRSLEYEGHRLVHSPGALQERDRRITIIMEGFCALQ
jgi:hypothetical protein